MGTKKKMFFNLAERKFHVLTAFSLYQAELYIGQKANSTAKVQCDACQHVMEREMMHHFKDYQTQESVRKLFETFAVFEPELYNEIRTQDITVGIFKILEYLSGQKIEIPEPGKAQAPNPPDQPPAPEPSVNDPVMHAIQAKDLLDKKNIIITKHMPKK